MAGPTPEELFGARLARDPGGPLVTFYDDATGERAELSAKSLANWIAKTYSLLTDSLGLGPGDTAQVRLPVHWLALPVLFGCWYAGLEVVTGRPSEVAFADAGSLDTLAPADELYAVSLLSMARPDTPPAGAEDYTAAVRPMPDAWAGVRMLAGPADPALDGIVPGRAGRRRRAAGRRAGAGCRRPAALGRAVAATDGLAGRAAGAAGGRRLHRAGEQSGRGGAGPAGRCGTGHRAALNRTPITRVLAERPAAQNSAAKGRSAWTRWWPRQRKRSPTSATVPHWRWAGSACAASRTS